MWGAHPDLAPSHYGIHGNGLYHPVDQGALKAKRRTPT
jgi:hypothetical protein